MECYINDKQKVYNAILQFLENSYDNNDEIKSNYLEILSASERDAEEMKHILQMIKSISDNHHRHKYFTKKVNQILQYYKDQIKQTFSNYEIFHMFESNKMIILLLLKNDIIHISEPIYKDMMSKCENNGNRYCHFFYPEIEKFVGEEKIKDVKKEILMQNPDAFENFDEKRNEGENDSYICTLMRQDSVEEFISYVNRHNISHSSHIKPSLFETNSFLIENNNQTLIEYSAFFGSIQIFQYLFMNNIKLTSSLWLYVIHSQNAEMIHILESNEVPSPIYENEAYTNYDDYFKCYIESIKCHHNDIADYIENNLFIQNEIYSEQKEEFISNCIKYHNYFYFNIDTIYNCGFFYLHLYEYKKLFELLIEMKEDEIKKQMISININDISILFLSNNNSGCSKREQS